MRTRALIAVAVGLGLVPALLLRAETRKDSPHGDLALDCGDCHSSERWVPAAGAQVLLVPSPFSQDAASVRPHLAGAVVQPLHPSRQPA